MDIPGDLVRRLTALSEALDELGTDLHTVLVVFIDDLRAAVPSSSGSE